jgi:Flp pilus assembly protein TadG
MKNLSVRNCVRRFYDDVEAAAVMELVIVIPFLVLLAIGVTEYGRVYFTAIKVASAAAAGAQYGAQNSGTTDSTFVNQAARADAGDPAIAVSSSRNCRCPDSETTVSCGTTCTGYGSPQFFVSVTASKSMPLLFRYPGLPAVIPVSRTITVRVQ